MTEPRLAAWRDRRRDPLTFRLTFPDPDTGRPVRHDYEVPEHPARVWVLAYLSDDPADLLLDVLEEEDADELWEEVRDPDSDVDVDLLRRIGKVLLGKVAGRPYWQAGRLIVQLVSDWSTFDGLAADRDLGDPLSWPLERVCNWVYLRITLGKEADEVARIDADLATPPDDVDPEELDELDEEGADWFTAVAALGGMADENGITRG